MGHLLKILIFLILILSNNIGFGQVDIDNEVIAELIRSEFKSSPVDTIFNRKGQIKQIHISKKPDILLVNETETFLFDPEVHSFDMFRKNGLSKLNSECYLDFIEKNKSKIHVDTISYFQGKINYMGRDELKRIFKDGGWDNYHRIFGFKPLVKVSLPGLNGDKTRAFIYYSSSTDGLGGAGFYLVLEKVDGKWTVIESMLAWIS
jgi:hypothetical protein